MVEQVSTIFFVFTILIIPRTVFGNKRGVLLFDVIDDDKDDDDLILMRKQSAKRAAARVQVFSLSILV